MATVADKLREHGIALRRDGEGNRKTTCPRCSHTRKNRKDPCLSVTVTSNHAVWHCHHCGWSGAVYEDNAHDDEAFRNRRRFRKREGNQRIDLGTARRRLRYGIDAT